MLYFIFWVLLILTIIVSVPVVNTIEKKRRLAAMPPEPENAPNEEDGLAGGDPGDGFGDVGEDSFGTGTGGGDFGAFDEGFK